MINDATINLIKQFENCKLKAYLCPAGVWTIGYGHTFGVTPGMTITQDDAENLLKKDLGEAEIFVRKLVHVGLTSNQLGALVSFVFNVGCGSFKQSTLLKLLNQYFYDQVPQQLMRWNKVKGEELGGLTRRRAAEAALWNMPDVAAA